jgi:REP element-mobilizing transposase RayT
MGLRGRNNITGESFFFVTTTVVRFLPIFLDYSFCDILINNIKYYQKIHMFDILAYVIMPSHFHWIVEVNPKYGTVSAVMRDIKKFTAWQIFDRIKETNQFELERIFKDEANGIIDQEKKLWMKRFDDEVIRNDRMFWTKLFYIHSNPVKAGLVLRQEDYKYSSARNYIHNDHSIIRVNTDMGGIYMP